MQAAVRQRRLHGDGGGGGLLRDLGVQATTTPRRWRKQRPEPPRGRKLRDHVLPRRRRLHGRGGGSGRRASCANSEDYDGNDDSTDVEEAAACAPSAANGEERRELATRTRRLLRVAAALRISLVASVRRKTAKVNEGVTTLALPTQEAAARARRASTNFEEGEKGRGCASFGPLCVLSERAHDLGEASLRWASFSGRQSRRVRFLRALMRL